MDKLDNHLKDIESKQNYHLQFLIVLFHHLEMNILSYIYWQYNLAIYLDQKVPEFIQKIQNTVLFIKSDIVPFKVLPIDCNALMLALDPALETFLELYCRYSRLQFFHYLLSAVKTRSP